MEYVPYHKRSWWQRTKHTLRGCRLKPALQLCLFEEEFCLDLLGFMISLPFMDRWVREPHEIMESWGVYYMEASIVWCWGDKTKFWHMPWDYDHISHEVLRADATWAPYVGSWEEERTDPDGAIRPGKQPDGRKMETFSYTYTLRSGEVQHRTATVHTERHEWRKKWLKWCPLFAKVRTSIDIEFDGEVGERTGSWKGGTIGCGWDLKRGETPEQALRRMEAERIFK